MVMKLREQVVTVTTCETRISRDGKGRRLWRLASAAAKLATMAMGDNKGMHRPKGSAQVPTLNHESKQVSVADAAKMLNVGVRTAALSPDAFDVRGLLPRALGVRTQLREQGDFLRRRN